MPMLATLFSILTFLILLGILVFIHELGHFLVAKWTGMRVDEFSLGFPPHIFKRVKGETTYAIGAIPFGGYVKICGENPEDEGVDDPRSFDNKPVRSRIAVILAGITMNLILAFVILTVAFSVGFTSVSQDLTQVPGASLRNNRVVVAGADAGTPAADAGIQAGDIITAISPKDKPEEKVTISTIGSLQSFTEIQQKAGVSEVVVYLEREGREVAKDSRLNPLGKPGLGVYIQSMSAIRVPVWRAPGVALKEMGAILDVTWSMLKDFGVRLFTKAQLDPQVSGPIGIYQATDTATRMGFDQVVFLAVALSLNLALLNVLPIPALDGGRFVFLLLEGIFRRRIIRRHWEQAITVGGFSLLMLLMAVLTARDIFRLF